jgi:hypothetical protein
LRCLLHQGLRSRNAVDAHYYRIRLERPLFGSRAFFRN